MIPRRIFTKIERELGRQAAVALLGPRQVGKTTLALEIAAKTRSVYLDLESREDRSKLAYAEQYLRQHEDHLVILDEIHRAPELFQSLRGVIDAGRRKGHRSGRFLILGSASLELLRQSETLAGRIAYVDLNPLDALEVNRDVSALTRLWVRGGFPDSYLANDDETSLGLRKNFIRTYLERDVAMFGPRIPSETLDRLWTMLANAQGSILNASRLATGLEVSATTVTRYIDLLVDLLLVRRLQPSHGNLGKRLVRSPKVYVRDSGLVHALLNVESYDELAGHPVVGLSWEGFVIENLLAVAPWRTRAAFYRALGGAEVDLVLDFPGGPRWVVEIKRSTASRPRRGFHHAREDLQPARAFVVYAGMDRYPMGEGVEAIGLRELMQEIAGTAWQR